jgi:(R,R)-butanediol dehydrogenase / meso-butanediol dehydrogenase / diacetyl reductase
VPSVLYQGNRTITVAERPVEPPGPGRVRIAVAYVGICGTDLHILHGAMDHRVRIPDVIGHEMSGRVAEVGPGVTGWAVGDPVTVMPLAWCGRCPACLAGNSHICHHLSFLGIDSTGAMQASWTVDAALLVRLPESLGLARAALVEPTAVAVHDVRRAGVVAGEQVVVVGAGPVGLLVALVARTVGAEVVLLELDSARRRLAEQLGLATLNPATDDVAARIDAWTAGAGAAVAFEVSGSAPGVAIATEVLAVRGRLVMVAIHPTPREVDLFRVFWRELSIVGARVYQRPDFERAVELVASAAIPADALISQVYPILHAAEAFAALERGGVMKVLVECGSGDA